MTSDHLSASPASLGQRAMGLSQSHPVLCALGGLVAGAIGLSAIGIAISSLLLPLTG